MQLVASPSVFVGKVLGEFIFKRLNIFVALVPFVSCNLWGITHPNAMRFDIYGGSTSQR